MPITGANHNFVLNYVYLVVFLLFQKTPTANKPIMMVRDVSTKKSIGEASTQGYSITSQCSFAICACSMSSTSMTIDAIVKARNANAVKIMLLFFVFVYAKTDNITRKTPKDIAVMWIISCVNNSKLKTVPRKYGLRAATVVTRPIMVIRYTLFSRISGLYN